MPLSEVIVGRPKFLSSAVLTKAFISVCVSWWPSIRGPVSNKSLSLWNLSGPTDDIRPGLRRTSKKHSYGNCYKLDNQQIVAGFAAQTRDFL
jgi:hypothetical protein